MPIIVNKDGILSSPSQIRSFYNAYINPFKAGLFDKEGVLYYFYRYDNDRETKLILMDSINKITRIYFGLDDKYRVTCIGSGGNGGYGGNKWGAYDGGQGGGGGTGGLVAIQANFGNPDIITAYLEFGTPAVRPPGAGPNTIYCRWVDYTPGIEHPAFYITSGSNGSNGNDAGVLRPQPGGGAGGQGGKVFYEETYRSGNFIELTSCIGYNGNNGGAGFNQVDPGERRGEGNAGEAPSTITVYNGLSVGTPELIDTIENKYQRPDNYYTASTFGNPNPITGYTIDNICLGNAGAGGWRTINYGNINPGTGAQGGIIIEHFY